MAALPTSVSKLAITRALGGVSPVDVDALAVGSIVPSYFIAYKERACGKALRMSALACRRHWRGFICVLSTEKLPERECRVVHGRGRSDVIMGSAGISIHNQEYLRALRHVGRLHGRASGGDDHLAVRREREDLLNSERRVGHAWGCIGGGGRQAVVRHELQDKMALGGVLARGLYTSSVVAVVQPCSSELEIMRVVGAESVVGVRASAVNAVTPLSTKN